MLSSPASDEAGRGEDAADVLTSTQMIRGVAAELAAEPAPMLAVAVDLVATRLPGYVARLDESGEDLEVMSSTLIDILIAALQSESELMLYEYWDVVREMGKRRCEQGFDMETLLAVMSIHREAVVEVFTSMLHEVGASEGLVRQAERRLDLLVEKLTVSLTLGYVDAWEERYEEQRAELEALIRITRAVNRSLELNEVTQSGLTELLKSMHLEAGALWLADGDGSLGLAQTAGMPPAEEEILSAWPVHESRFLRLAITSETPVQDRIHSRIAPLRRFGSVLAAGLRSGRGDLLGVLAVGTSSERQFTASELAFAHAVADHLIVAVEHARQLQREARTDFLTGVANRQEFEHSIERQIAAAKRSGRPLTVALFDLDNLKTINDNYGHHTGDRAIRALGQALRQGVRASDISARLGGDEFAVALPDVGLAQAEELGRRIRAILAARPADASLPLPVSVSFGFAEWKPGMDWSALFAQADRALYLDKRSRKPARPRRRRSSRAAGGHDSAGAEQSSQAELARA